MSFVPGKIVSTTSVVLFLIVMTGCDTGYDGPPLYEAGGTVTYRGEPVSGCKVNFSLQEDSSRKLGVHGTTDEEGRFSLVSSDIQGTLFHSGAMEGTYLVSISKWEEFPPGEEKPPKSLLPRKYSSYSTSQLDAAVTAAGPNEFEFILTD